MFWKNSPPPGKPFREDPMTAATQVMETAREFIDVAGDGETVKARLRSASLALGIPFGTAKRIRYGEVKTIPAHIFTTMLDRYAIVLDRKEREASERLRIHRSTLDAWRQRREAGGFGSFAHAAAAVAVAVPDGRVPGCGSSGDRGADRDTSRPDQVRG